MSTGRRLGRIFEQARRRRVFRVVGVYAVAAWAVIEVSSTVFPLLGLPEWGPRLIVVLALLGFPLAVVLAWMFDLTPGGVVRTVESDRPAEVPSVSPQRAFAGRAAGFFGLGILVALVTFAAYSRFGPEIGTGARTEAISSIAVLPFTDLSPAGDQAYFGDGMAEELLNRLAHVEGLRVAARTSSFAFKGKNEDIQGIGRQLGVESVLEGSVRKEGNSLRVTAQLIDARTGFHIWSETYDRSEASVFAIQDEISNAIVTQLRKQLAVPAGNATGGTDDVRAHELYLQGRALWNQRTDASVRQAVARFEEALNQDPDYALAWAGLAQAWSVLPSLGDTPIEEAAERGNEAAARALAIDGQLAEAHAALGQMAQNFEWDLAAAEQAYRRATEFNPGYATAHQWYAEVSMLQGDTARARTEITEAIELDPLSPAALAVRAYLRAVNGDEEGALSGFHDLGLLYPSYANGAMNLALLALELHRPADALAALPAAASGNAELAVAFRAVADAVADPARRPDAETALTGIESRLPLSLLGLWYAALGDDEAAMRRLERAGAARSDSNLPLALLHPLLRGLRPDPRFQSLAQQVGVVLPH